MKVRERFKTLVRHFFGRFFDKDSIAADADEHANVIQIIAMLALPGAIVSLFTMVDHPLIRSEVTRLWLRAGDRYVFVCYSMVVMGFVMTFKWDSLFPDRKDYLILTPLPIGGNTIFAGKTAALILFLGIFVIPPLYVAFQALRERLRPSTRPQEKPKTAPAEPALASHEAPLQPHAPATADSTT